MPGVARQLVLVFDSPEDWAEEALASAREAFPLQTEAVIEWRDYPTTAGRAYFEGNRIRLSRRVLETEEQVRDTVLHEYAHLVVNEMHGPSAKPHGKEWRAVMKRLGAKAKATHDYPVERRYQARRIVYRCTACGYLLLRARPLRRHLVYTHIGCGGTFAR